MSIIQSMTSVITKTCSSAERAMNVIDINMQSLEELSNAGLDKAIKYREEILENNNNVHLERMEQFKAKRTLKAASNEPDEG